MRSSALLLVLLHLLLLLLLLGGCGHSIRPEFAPNYPDRSFDFATPPCQLSAKPGLEDDQVAIRYLGAGGLYIEWQGTALLMSPFFSNPRTLAFPLGHLRIDQDAVRRGLEMDLSRVRAIAAGHSHYDHIGDLPLVADTYAPGARVYVNNSGAHALAHVPILAGRVTSLESDEANGWIYLKDPDQNDLPIRFLKVPSQHAPHFWGIHLSKGEVAKDWENGWETYRLHSLREGRTFAFVIDLRSPDLKTTVFRIYYQDAASPPEQGIPQLTGDDGKPGFDLAVLCMASYYIVRKQPGTILAALHPRHVLVTHYENFFRDTRKSVEFVPLLTNFWANRFFVRARRVMNLWESQTAGPEGPVCGPSDRHWTMPMPGEWVKFRVR